uniref:Si:ch211-108d22.2 n=1 Tax=Poecilia latipinna TaxID=48699 RepID=A0A3B3VUG8_9TELE
MACSSQSASDYIKSARGHLVGQLTSLSVILENLYQQKVLMEEEVSNIEAEKSHFNRTRAILDSVTKKGEEACYRLLRILYETRSRTLPAPHPKNKHSASTKAKRFDLHHWISCFPFRDDDSKPCHRYQAKLKTEAEKFSNNIWRRSENLFEENKKPGLSFYSLVLNTEGTTTPSKVKTFKNKKSNMYRSKKLRTYIPESKPEISPSDLLKHDKNILLVGKPGMGKTALSHEMLRLWSERDKQLDYMFYFDMRELTNIPPTMSLEDLLFNVHCEPDEGKDEILTDMKSHSDNLIIILDGVTDFTSLVVKKFAKKNLPYAKIIITCRPEDEDQDKKDFCPKDWLRVEVKGFSKETISRYLSSVLGEDHRKVLSNVELLTLCHVPMYALMVAASFSSEDSLQPRTVTEIYINIVRFCLQMNSSKIKMKNLNQFIKTKSNEILSLAEAAFNATERKTVNLEELSCEDGCVLSFLKTLDVKVAPTETITLYAFLHYTMQEFFAALWALKSPDKIREVLQQFLTEEKKHMKHLIPFMCRLLNQKSPSLMICLTPAEELKETQQWVTKDLIDTVLSHGSERHVDMLFLCQCLYESQSSEPCISFLDKLNYHIDLSRKNLDPHSCCAVSYVISQSTDRKINLNLQDVTISVQGMRRLRRCLQNVELRLYSQMKDRETQTGLSLLPSLQSIFQSAPEVWIINLSERKTSVLLEVIKLQPEKKPVMVTNFSHEKSEVGIFLQCLPHISQLFGEQAKFLVNLFCAAAKREQQTGKRMLEMLASVCRYETFPSMERFMDYDDEYYDYFDDYDDYHDVAEDQSNFLLDLYSQMKDRETQTGLSLLPSLQSVFQSAPEDWTLKLSQRKTSILLEVMKLQPEKKPVELRDCSHEESEVGIFLQCLPHISQLDDYPDDQYQSDFLLDLYSQMKDRETQSGLSLLPTLQSVFQSAPPVWFLNLSKRKTSILLEVMKLQPEKKPVNLTDCSHEESEVGIFLQCLPHISQLEADHQNNFFLSLYFHLKDRETQTGLSLLPSLQSVFQSAPKVWIINLSKIKTSILLEVMKLQPEKKPVELKRCSHEKSEVGIFLQCLPHISELNLFCAAAERETQTGEKMLQVLASVCRYETFPLNKRENLFGVWGIPTQTDFLLDLYSQLKDRETQTGLSLLPSLRSVFQSAPPVWSIDLSERKTSILLEVMKLQPEKKPVKLKHCSHEESEVGIFLQCLPHISQLFDPWSSAVPGQIKFLVNLFCAAAERETQTGEKMLQMLASVCRYETFPFNKRENLSVVWRTPTQTDFLLSLYSQMKDRETQTGLSLLPSLQSVFQSAPPVWIINLSERKTSILLEVMKLQPEKKPVNLTVCSHGESEVRIFLQCLPHISQLNLFCAAAETEKQTGEKMLQMLASVCRYETLELNVRKVDEEESQNDFLLDLYSQVRDCETRTGLSLLPSVQPVFQSAPSLCITNLSEGKTSILLEVLKLQPEKKPVVMMGASLPKSEVGSFLQGLPHISQI